jgi:hypothetical protein
LKNPVEAGSGNEIERAVALAADGRPILPEHLSARVRAGAVAARGPSVPLIESNACAA